MKLNRNRSALLCAVAVVSFAAVAAAAPTVEKVADLAFYSADGIGVGGYAPLDRFTQIGTNLWFTTSRGGTYDAGTISRFDLVTREVVQVASFDNYTGKASESWLLPIGDEAYFTTVNGGASNKGTLAKIDLATGAITTLHDFATNGLPTGATPRAGLTRIGDELWTTTSLGGTSNRGVILKYNLTNGVTSLVTNFDGPVLGGQPFGGFTPAGSNAWFFTTFTGGSTLGQSGLPLGAGTLGRLSFDASGNPRVARLADLTAGYPQFPALEPTPVGSNAIYFATTGPNASPGAILRYDLAAGLWTNLYSFRTNAADALAVGTRPGYCGLVEWLGELYFINRSGGTSNLGVVAKFNLASNSVTKLADLDGTGGQALGSAAGFFGTGTIVEESNRFYLYYPLTSGGVNNRGTILRVALPAPPIQLTLAPGAAGEVALSWTGGYPPFAVQARENVSSGDWTDWQTEVAARSVTVPATNNHAFFRVVGAP